MLSLIWPFFSKFCFPLSLINDRNFSNFSRGAVAYSQPLAVAYSQPLQYILYMWAGFSFIFRNSRIFSSFLYVFFAVHGGLLPSLSFQIYSFPQEHKIHVLENFSNCLIESGISVSKLTLEAGADSWQRIRNIFLVKTSRRFRFSRFGSYQRVDSATGWTGKAV